MNVEGIIEMLLPFLITPIALLLGVLIDRLYIKLKGLDPVTQIPILKEAINTLIGEANIVLESMKEEAQRLADEDGKITEADRVKLKKHFINEVKEVVPNLLWTFLEGAKVAVWKLLEDRFDGWLSALGKSDSEVE